MDVTLHIPDELAQRLKAAGGDLSRRALEALALEEYKLGHLTAADLCGLLSLGTPADMDGFLKAHGLQVAIRRKRIDVAFRDRALTHLAHLPITIDPETDAQAWTTTLQLADRFQLTLYDAAYLELAQRRALPLATLDSALRPAAEALGLTLLGV